MQPTLTLITWNVGMLIIKRLGYIIVEPAPYKDMRLRFLPRVLNSCSANVVALQELYHPREVAYVIDKTRKRFPYYAIAEAERPGSRLNPGLVVLSDKPIVKSAFHAFRVVPPDEHAFVWKGMLDFTVDAGPFGMINMLNVHNTSGGMLWSPDNWIMHRVRQAQYQQMFAHARRSPAASRIIMGDFNAGPENPEGSYRHLVQPDFYDAWTKHHGADLRLRKPTWDPTSPLNQEGPHHHQKMAESLDGFHLDHNLAAIADIEHIDTVFSTPIVRGPMDHLLPISDHNGVELRLVKK